MDLHSTFYGIFIYYRNNRWLSVDPLADKYPGWSPYNYTLNNQLKYIDPNGMYSAATEDGSDPEEDEWFKKKRQESTFNYLKQIAETGNKVWENISKGVNIIYDEVSAKTENVVENGPDVLTDISTGITVGGYTVGMTAAFTATPATGGAIIAGTNLITAPIDLFTVGLQTIKTLNNPTQDNIIDLGEYMIQSFACYKVGNAAYKGVRLLNYIKFDLSPFSMGGLMGF